MSQRYLLPCECGQQVVVEPRQAGGSVVCTCGARLSVPSLRQLDQLAPAAEDAAAGKTGAATTGKTSAAAEHAPQTTRTSSWGIRQGLMLLGGVVIFATLIVAVYFRINRPSPPAVDRAAIAKWVEQLTPLEAWLSWRIQILEEGMIVPKPASVRAYEAAEAAQTQRYIATGFFGALGLVILLAGLCWPKHRAGTARPRR